MSHEILQPLFQNPHIIIIIIYNSCTIDTVLRRLRDQNLKGHTCPDQ